MQLHDLHEGAGVEGAGSPRGVRSSGERVANPHLNGPAADVQLCVADDLLEHPAGGPTRGDPGDGVRHHAEKAARGGCALRPRMVRESPPRFGEDPGGVWPADDEPHQVDHLVRSLRTLRSHLFLEAADLNHDHVAQAETAWEADGDVLILQHLLRPIAVAQRLQQEEGEQRGDGTTATTPGTGRRGRFTQSGFRPLHRQFGIAGRRVPGAGVSHFRCPPARRGSQSPGPSRRGDARHHPPTGAA